MNRLVYLCALFTAGLAEVQEAVAQEPVTAPDNEVVVIGTRSPKPLKDSPVPVRVVDRKEIEAAGDVTAADAMARIVGVNVETTVRTGATPQIHGFGSKHVLVLIDGRRATGRIADDFDLARIPASSIERIEVLKGASSVLYGSDAIGGVINVITRRAKKGLRGGVRVQRDSLHRDEASAYIGHGGDAFSFLADGGHGRGPSYDLEKRDEPTTGNAYERHNGQLELGFKPHEKWDLSVAYSTEDGTTAGVGAGSRGTLLDRTTKARGRSSRAMARYRPDADGEIRLEGGEAHRIYGLFEDQRGGDASDRRLDSVERAGEGSLVASRAYADAHETVAGVEAGTQKLVTNQMDSGSKRRRRTSGFVQHQWKPASFLTLVPGVRLDDDSQFGDHVSKAFTTRLDPADDVVIRLSYGEGYRAPSFSELYLSFVNTGVGYQVNGNEELQPERSRSGQGSVAWQASSAVWLSLGVFDNQVKDLISTVRTQPAGGLLTVDYANVERVRNQGIESSFRLRASAALSLGLDYTFLRAIDQTRERTLEGRPLHSGSVQVRHELADAGLTTALVVNLVGKRPFYVDTPAGPVTEWSESYRAATLKVAKRFARAYEVFTGVRNLTNEGQEKMNPVPPRAYFGGVGAEI